MRKLCLISIAVGFSLALAGCDERIKTACPALKTYTLAQQRALAAKFASLPIEARTFINDYGQLRAICRAIAK